MTYLERILASKSVEALLDICIGPVLDSPRKDRTEQKTTATASVGDRFQGYTTQGVLADRTVHREAFNRKPAGTQGIEQAAIVTGLVTLATEGAGMKAILHVLSIGAEDSCNTVRDALLQRRSCRLSVVTSLWDLYAIQQQNSFDIATLHQTLSPREVRDASEYIRRRWPRAKILVICAETEFLDDPLYDEWVPPGLSPGILLETIEELTDG
jgi:hypothetical protein